MLMSVDSATFHGKKARANQPPYDSTGSHLTRQDTTQSDLVTTANNFSPLSMTILTDSTNGPVTEVEQLIGIYIEVVNP